MDLGSHRLLVNSAADAKCGSSNSRDSLLEINFRRCDGLPHTHAWCQPATASSTEIASNCTEVLRSVLERKHPVHRENNPHHFKDCCLIWCERLMMNQSVIKPLTKTGLHHNRDASRSGELPGTRRHTESTDLTIVNKFSSELSWENEGVPQLLPPLLGGAEFLPQPSSTPLLMPSLMSLGQVH